MCEHLDRLASRRPVTPSSPGCQECLAEGTPWVELRLCLTCGHVGCCDSSPGRHATAHWHATRHPTIKAFEPGEEWAWCYPDAETVERIGVYAGESPPVHLASPTEGAGDTA